MNVKSTVVEKLCGLVCFDHLIWRFLSMRFLFCVPCKRVLRHHAIRALQLHLILIIQTSLLTVICAKVPEVQEESILTPCCFYLHEPLEDTRRCDEPPLVCHARIHPRSYENSGVCYVGSVGLLVSD